MSTYSVVIFICSESKRKLLLRSSVLELPAAEGTLYSSTWWFSSSLGLFVSCYVLQWQTHHSYLEDSRAFSVSGRIHQLKIQRTAKVYTSCHRCLIGISRLRQQLQASQRLVTTDRYNQKNPSQWGKQPQLRPSQSLAIVDSTPNDVLSLTLTRLYNSLFNELEYNFIKCYIKRKSFDLLLPSRFCLIFLFSFIARVLQTNVFLQCSVLFICSLLPTPTMFLEARENIQQLSFWGQLISVNIVISYCFHFSLKGHDLIWSQKQQHKILLFKQHTHM